MADLLLGDVTLPAGGAPVDILVRDGRIAAIGAGLSRDGVVVEELAGHTVLPAFTDAHVHVDKTVWGSDRWLPTVTGTIAEKIAHNARVRDEWGIPNPTFIANLLDQMVACGSTRIRTHADVDPAMGLRSVETVREVAERFRGLLDVEIVAFPQQGLISKPGVTDLLRDATEVGATVIGGIDPAGIDGDPIRSLDALFALATGTGCGIDIHLHDHGDLGAWEIELICERTIAEGLQGKVTLSHPHALGEAEGAQRARLIDLVAEAGVNVVTMVSFNFAVLPLRELVAAGATVALGNNSIRNTWSPFGTGDMLQRAMIAATRYEANDDAQLSWILSLVTEGGAALMGAERPAVEVGRPADLVVVEALNEYDAVVRTPPRHLVLKGGRPVARDGLVLRNGGAH